MAPSAEMMGGKENKKNEKEVAFFQRTTVGPLV